MSISYDLTKLDPNSFEHLVNALALRVLGAGHTGFGPGKDGGRDGFFEGEAPYPSSVDRWNGRWYIQSKFHQPNLSKNPQQWLVEQIKEEVKEFNKPTSKRQWPDNWIIATNIEPSGVPETGAFDQAKKIVNKANPKLKGRFHIWGGRKILDFLAQNPEVSAYYKHFLTPGHILTELFEQIRDKNAELKTILQYLIVKQFDEQQYTKLEQAGSAADIRPGIHRLFIDLPFRAEEHGVEGLATKCLVQTSAKNHQIDSNQPDSNRWRYWFRHPSRARVWFIKGGPGQGKSTIGQYFCQIQRAALILHEDGLTVKPQLKSVAREVKRAAIKDEFWPTVPRIPISIELKEYAQWFGRRNKDVRRGVLTYLAERISAGVEQEVLVGTLKRALQTRSWLVVFDGLDEVPQDVKDAVAIEVRNFVDNVAIDNNCDLLTICTSRPQGYSGQFAELDGPTINLTHLSPDRALLCARPVLELGRSEEDSKKYFLILKNATESSSVRELMTTPLQSHIMAVVVRDGGRPPERRWHLFTNFYQVIRRREANRDLPDKRLAKLLREDERLLKTVHNRLGFLLQARAETSSGAQTHLKREEFESLVKRAVEIMIDEEVEGTIKVLVSATTDRLVLVSTPDDGDHVRFDIRPLQEFFAAEFFYESADAEVIRHRIDTVAGDSHWREVMHFLLSALIENNRLTDMYGALGVLEHLNESAEAPEFRLLNRRLGRGALLAARLLQEGVLEQDKRIRQQFRKCLEPLTAFTEASALVPLIEVNQRNSKQWLLNFLLDSLREADPSESIGAAIVLSFVLPDNDERVNWVKEFLLSSSPEYMSHVFISRAPEKYLNDFKSTPIKKWFLDLTLRKLTHDEGVHLSAEGLTAALKILRADTREVVELANEKGLPDVYIALLNYLLTESIGYRTEEMICDYGIVKGYLSEHDWVSGTSDFEHWGDEELNTASQSQGILQLVYRIVKFSKARTYNNYKALITSSGIGLSERLPETLRIFIPLVSAWTGKSKKDVLRCLSEDEFDELVSLASEGSVDKPAFSFTLGENFNIEGWKVLLQFYLGLALHLWCDRSFIRRGLKVNNLELWDSKESLDHIKEAVIRNKSVLIGIAPYWGKLLNTFKDQSPVLRDALVELCSQNRPVSYINDVSDREPFHTFQLNLPHEASLLPFIVASIMPNYESFSGKEESDLVIQNVSSRIGKLVQDESALERIFSSAQYDNNIRAGAILLHIFHPNGSRDLSSKQHILIELYSSADMHWYLSAVTGCIALISSERDQAARFIMGNLLEATRADYAGRQILQTLLARWRENSYAPINEVGAELEWLNSA
ncbi:MAG: hypothetical protein QOE46_2649 [Acidobacteriota bacterium]|jgi:hypothetical protein|nr:hypothetical protein [Acidobacteriota bacterium]